MVTVDLAPGKRFHYELRTGMGDRHTVPYAYRTTIDGRGRGTTVRVSEDEALDQLRALGVID